jgi:hypothetical protein
LDSDWLGAIADTFAAIGTVGAFLVGFLLLRREHHREAGRAEDERRAQAERISAWVELIRKVDGSRELDFHIHNASAMPIYEVELPLPARGDEEPGSEFVGLVPPGQTIQRSAPGESGCGPTSSRSPYRSSSWTVPADGGAATSRERCPARIDLSLPPAPP